ncbi:MAG: 1-acyl-sn-glycerol-3-phosphate acyltransferase [Rhodobacteraceae bacterium]|nr:1-acyl-sn-glycerol-3-phosphate acyltransferase [Paracoccaceae bacterium]MCP5340913.1 1-acyl-sn-glycerol-3-phosphate acyltransferase [Paracoccaceae bacterium]
MSTWNARAEPDPVRIGPAGWVRAALRATALGGVTYGCLGVLLAARLIEAPLFGMNRPVTPNITRFVCRSSLAILGMRYRVTGQPMKHRGAVVANHVSWLDIFSLNACQKIYFVSKSEVAGWAGIGWLARATGTAFIARDPKEARAQRALIEDRIRAGHQLLFFPEGTSTDGLRVLPFKSTLFAAFFSHGLEQALKIQPVSVVYRAPAGQDPHYYGWWGDMGFGAHFWKTLATRRQGTVDVVFHQPVSVDAFESRKELAAHCEAVVRDGVKNILGADYLE